MLSLLSYILINCIIFLFLRRKNFKVAAFAHVMLFGISLACFLCSGAIPDVLPVLNKIFGAQNVLLLRKSLWGINGISLVPILVLELATVLLAVFACFITVAEVVHVLVSHKIDINNVGAKKQSDKIVSVEKPVSEKIFMLYCRYLC